MCTQDVLPSRQCFVSFVSSTEGICTQDVLPCHDSCSFFVGCRTGVCTQDVLLFQNCSISSAPSGKVIAQRASSCYVPTHLSKEGAIIRWPSWYVQKVLFEGLAVIRESLYCDHTSCSYEVLLHGRSLFWYMPGRSPPCLKLEGTGDHSPISNWRVQITSLFEA